jgi:hypothetical protein
MYYIQDYWINTWREKIVAFVFWASLINNNKSEDLQNNEIRITRTVGYVIPHGSHLFILV